MDPAKLIDLMRRKGVIYARVGELEITLHDSVFAPASQPMQAMPDLDRCFGCGHSLAVEHSDLGCLKGCANELCARQEAQA